MFFAMQALEQIALYTTVLDQVFFQFFLRQVIVGFDYVQVICEFFL